MGRSAYLFRRLMRTIDELFIWSEPVTLAVVPAPNISAALATLAGRVPPYRTQGTQYQPNIPAHQCLVRGSVTHLSTLCMSYEPYAILNHFCTHVAPFFASMLNHFCTHVEPFFASMLGYFCAYVRTCTGNFPLSFGSF